MFERYAEKARRVIFFARYEASQLEVPRIEPEHLLLGLLRFGGMPVLGQQTTLPDGGPPYVPTGGVQIGPEGVNGNPPPGPIGAGSPQQGDAGTASCPSPNLAFRQRHSRTQDELLRMNI